MLFSLLSVWCEEKEKELYKHVDFGFFFCFLEPFKAELG